MWELSGAACKLFSLFAIAGLTGGSYSLWLVDKLGFAKQQALLTYLLASALIGLLASPLFFLVQVGAINQSGIVGMFDRTMITILAQSNLGAATGWRVAAFSAALPAWYLLQRVHKNSTNLPTRSRSGFAFLLAAIFCASVSFAISGHTSTLALSSRVIIVLHVLAAFLWVGSLYPLLQVSKNPDVKRVQRLMRVFGSSALLIVAALVASGIFLLTRLLHSFAELLTTSYGLTLLLKLAGVSLLLALAAANKLVLVPGLLSGSAIARLRTAIRMELVAAFFILLMTVYLTTAVGPLANPGKL